jgi:DNA polymerase III subunit epsilon
MEKPAFKWKLDRPLAVFDIEATGINVRTDRIVEICIIKLMPKGKRESFTFRINPTIPIPPEATKIHGITDADVADRPRFTALAKQLNEIFEGCDLGGYNLIHFDIPILIEEFLRANIKFEVDGRRILDAQRIFHKREPRDLTAALAYYCGEMHLDAHGAEADVLATIRVMEGEFEKYSDLPRDMDELDKYCNPRDPSWVDRTGKLKWLKGEIVLNFGKKKDVTLRSLIKDDPNFVKWMLKSDFPRDMQEIVQNASQGIWPPAPAAAG